MEDSSPEEVKEKMFEFERHLLKGRMFVGQILTKEGMFSARVVASNSKISDAQDKVCWVFMAHESNEEYEICLAPKNF
jgi:hypothetical protein